MRRQYEIQESHSAPRMPFPFSPQLFTYGDTLCGVSLRFARRVYAFSAPPLPEALRLVRRLTLSEILLLPPGFAPPQRGR